MSDENVTNEAVKIAEEFIEGIPERLEGYGELLGVIEELMYDFLVRAGFDPFHFLFWAFVLLLFVLSLFSKWKVGKWVLLGVAVVAVVAWVL